MSDRAALADTSVPERVPAAAVADAWRARLIENGVPHDDVVRTVAGIGAYAQWCDAWSATAARRVAEAEAEDDAGHGLTAAGLWLIAAMEYHFAKHVFVHDEVRRARAQRRLVACYAHAVGRLPWPGGHLEIPFEGTALPAILRLPARHGGPWPVVVLVPGLDATKEELHHFSEQYLARGLATVALDGPGQGEVEEILPIRADWELVASAVLQRLVEVPGLEVSRAAVVGLSLGGYYAARAAGADPRWRAGVSLGGCHDLAGTWDALPPLTRNAFAVRSGASTPEEVRERAGALDLSSAPLVADGGDFLVVHGCRDALFDEEQARRMVDHFQGRATAVWEPEGDHVCHNLAYRVRPRIADWVARRLGADAGLVG